MTDEHFLIVEKFDPDDDTDRFDVEHPADCPVEDIGTAGFEHHVYNCPVAWQLDACGLDMFFHHADDPSRQGSYADRVAPGRHQIEAWAERVCTSGPWGPEEWDAGLRLVDDEA